MTAYNPFGRMLAGSYDGATDYSGAMNDTGILYKEMMPAAPTADSRRFLVYNCGTERVAATLKIAGTVDAENGLTITNTTNGSTCKVIGLTESAIPEGSWLEINGELGQVYQVIGDEHRLAFEFHDLGYLQLEPCTPVIRDVLVNCEAGSRIVTSNIGAFAEAENGQYIYLDGQWR